MRAGAEGPWARGAIVLAVFLAGFNMRAALVAAMPLLEVMRLDLETNRTVIGLLTTLPVLLMGLVAPLAPKIAGRARLEIVLASTMFLVAVSALFRLWGGLTVLFATAAFIGIAIAIGQPLVMGFTKARFAGHVAVMAGVYAAGVNVGAAFAARSALPIYESSGDWRTSLAIWAIPAMASGLLWVLLPTRSTVEPRRLGDVGVWRLPKAWALAVFFAITVLVYYSVLTWLAPAFIDQGWSPVQAGVLLSNFSLLQLPGTLVFPWLAGRTGTYKPWLVATIGLTVAGLLMAASGDSVSPWLVVIALGIGTGGMFPLCLALPIANARDTRTAASLSAMSFAVGYGAGALGPSLVGWLRDATGGFAVAFVALAVLTAVQLAFVPRVVPASPDGQPAL
jgi:CP family cyanate transporter-like MFS transporter